MTEELQETLLQLKHDAEFRAANNMKSGGHFAAAISDAYFYADSKNKDKLVTAFADLFKRFNY